jgi:WD40 repeat protein
MSDYQEVIQNPGNCFSDATLKTGTPALNMLGLPSPITGGFCSVYKVTAAKTNWAVRCFLHDISDLRDRYKQISGYLRRHRPKHMVGFEYLTEGIRVRGAWHPVLKMEWVDGDTLDVWIDKHQQDARALRKLSERWIELLKGLEKEHIGHCDLQHGNVLVDKSDGFRLIDYDGMYVPPLRGRGSHEKGHPAYQHPQREGTDFDEQVDHFPALVIQTSLLAVAESPALWKKYYEGDNLIFRRSDFDSPDRAPVFQDLKGLGGGVAEHADALREACKQRLGKTPRLRELKLKNPAGPVKLEPAPAIAAPVSAAPANGNAGKGAGTFPLPKPVAPPPAAKPAKVAKPAPAPPPAPLKLAAAPPKPVVKTPPAVKAPAPAKAPAVAMAAAATAAKPLLKSHLMSPPPAMPASGAKSTVAIPASSRAASRAASARAASRPASGWSVEWTRPGAMNETHIWQLPVYGTREAPRRILGIPFGTHMEKFVESYEEKVEECDALVAGHRSRVSALAFTSDGRLLVSGARDGTVRVWNVQTGREACAHLDLHSAVVAMTLAPDRPLIAATLADRRLVLWDFGPRRQIVHLNAPDKSSLKAVAISNDGRWEAAGGNKRKIYTWQTDRGVAGGEMKQTTGRIESLAFTPDAGAVVCGTHKGRLELFERGTDAPSWSIRTGLGRIVALAMPPRASGVLGGAAEGTVASWNMTDGSETHRVRPMLGRLTSLAITPDASHLLVGLASGHACLHESGADRELAKLDGHAGAVTATALPSTGKFAATGSTDGSVRLWVVR